MLTNYVATALCRATWILRLAKALKRAEAGRHGAGMGHGGHSSGISENGTRKGQNFTIKDTKRESRTNTKDKKLSSVLE